MHSVGQKCPHDLLYLKARRCSVMRHWPGSQRGPWLSPALHLPLLSDRDENSPQQKVHAVSRRPGEDWPWGQTLHTPRRASCAS